MVKPWLQYLILFFMLLNIVCECCMHNKTEFKKHDGVKQFIITAAVFAIYYAGGFFDGLLR